MAKALDDFPINTMSLDNLDYDQLMILTRLLLNAEENYGNDDRPEEMADCALLLDRVRDRRREMLLWPEA